MCRGCDSCGLGTRIRQDAVVELGVDVSALVWPGSVDAELELAHAARAAAQDALALALLDLAPHDELGVAHLDVDVLLVDARELGLDDPGVVGLLDVDRRDPRRAAGAPASALSSSSPICACSWSNSRNGSKAPGGAGGHVASAGRYGSHGSPPVLDGAGSRPTRRAIGPWTLVGKEQLMAKASASISARPTRSSPPRWRAARRR